MFVIDIYIYMYIFLAFLSKLAQETSRAPMFRRDTPGRLDSVNNPPAENCSSAGEAPKASEGPNYQGYQCPDAA